MRRIDVRRGFTLLELLVVIGIIAILMSLAAVAYSSAQKSTRDAKRRGDMKALQSALEQYYAANFYAYPADGTCSLIANPAYLEKGVKPTDPGSYSYTYNCAGTSYCVCAQMESGGGNSINSSCNYGSGNYYCVTNLQ